MANTSEETKKEINQKRTVFTFKGFSVQLFLVTVLPLTVLLLVVAFGSQTLHHEAMRSLVGSRDLQTVRATANSIERELSHLSSTIQILSRSAENNSALSSLILQPEEISATFDGGISLYSNSDILVQSTSTSVDWSKLPGQIPEYFSSLQKSINQPVFSSPISSADFAHTYVLVGIASEEQKILIGAFSPDLLIKNAIGDLINIGQTTILVISPNQKKDGYSVLFHGGPLKVDESLPTHPGIQDVLNGKSGINYYQSSEGEHVIAFSPISETGWGLVTEEAWEDISSPYLASTQAAPLVFVPVFLIAIFIIWFGARRIVTPLQNLEKQASSLASGDFEAIRQLVGGIEEIRNLQTEMIEMADKLKSAQQNLHSYIGDITAGIENERRSLARELHDDTIQTMIAINQRIQMILMNSPEMQKGSLNELQTLVQQSMTNLRRMIRGLRPIYLEDLGLVTSLDMLAGEMGQTAAIPITFVANGQEHRLDPQIELSLYRMVQESLNNVIHHAKAKHAWVEMDFSEKGLDIQIRDDGIGFVVPINPSEFPKNGHFGLLGLKERAELIHAELEINSTPDNGTIILIRLPGYKNILSS